MLKTACSFTGDNYKLLSVDTPASKKKVVAMSIAMLVPVLIWVFNGFMLSSQVLKAGWGWALLTAVVCGSIVFLIEKLIIMAKGNKWLTFFRVSIGLVVALLGSIAIDEVIFSDDIDISVAEIKKDYILDAKRKAEKAFSNLNNIPELNNKLVDAQNKYDHAEAVAIAEAEGSKGTGKVGLGKVANYKDQKAQQRKQDLSFLENSQFILTAAKDSVVNQAQIKAGFSFNDHALLTRIKALFHLVAKDGYMLTVYILFTLLMFFFEFLVVILKLTWDKTNYERKLEMIEEIGIRRIEFLLGKNSPLTDPGNYLPQFEATRNSLGKPSSLYN